MENALDHLLEAWRKNDRIHSLLLDAISEEGLRATLSKRGGRTVARQFAHLHNVRRWQLEGRAKDLAEGLYKFGPKEEPTAEQLAEHLGQSGERVGTYFARCLGAEGTARPFKSGIFTALAYFISHESHHRGNILLTLKQTGHKIEKKVQYKIWDWDRV